MNLTDYLFSTIYLVLFVCVELVALFLVLCLGWDLWSVTSPRLVTATLGRANASSLSAFFFFFLAGRAFVD